VHLLVCVINNRSSDYFTRYVSHAPAKGNTQRKTGTNLIFSQQIPIQDLTCETLAAAVFHITVPRVSDLIPCTKEKLSVKEGCNFMLFRV
jgi:hypothetical protein